MKLGVGPELGAYTPEESGSKGIHEAHRSQEGVPSLRGDQEHG